MSGLGTLHSLAVDEFPCMKNLQRGAKGPKTLPSRSPRALKESEPGHDLQVCKGWRDSTAEVFCKASPHRRHPCPCRAPLARGDLSWGLWVPLPWSLPDTGGTLGSFPGGDARVLHRLFPQLAPNPCLVCPAVEGTPPLCHHSVTSLTGSASWEDREVQIGFPTPQLPAFPLRHSCDPVGQAGLCDADLTSVLEWDGTRDPLVSLPTSLILSFSLAGPAQPEGSWSWAMLWIWRQCWMRLCCDSDRRSC